MKRVSVSQGLKRAACTPLRPMSAHPATEMRRPEATSHMYRAVQDWKPLCHEVAHSRGKEIEDPQGKVCIMHMTLIDCQGFRWPVRFVRHTMMRLIDVIRRTDDDWFGVQPGGETKDQQDRREGVMGVARINDACELGNPNPLRCSSCAVSVPYEYLDAMEPPNRYEMSYLREKAANGTIHPQANTRLACQVYIEDWMDGMTVVLPQTDSMVYQLYYRQGVDKDTVHQQLKFRGEGYGFPEKTDEMGHLTHGQQFTQGELAIDNGDSMHPTSMGHKSVPLSKVFWMDDIDDIIRTRYPAWKGRYEFMNK
eukprot:TRINITY_DN20235_c0_g1_i1.p1 TRINITY_DN20235_c0_g1~~TRINITY_DN20235_c0_g1_i1.p1  ORF type:complete len:309 (+),score=56.56 TRINITY_DN20235_c0_g1_i1:66-992(+)